MRKLVRMVGGLVSSGSCCVKSVNSGACCQAASERSPSMTGGFDTRTACRTGCSGQFAPRATAAARSAATTRMLLRAFIRDEEGMLEIQHLAENFLSNDHFLTTTPSFITNETCSVAWMSSSGLPG